MLLFHRIIIVALPETEVKRKFIPAKQFSQKKSREIDVVCHCRRFLRDIELNFK